MVALDWSGRGAFRLKGIVVPNKGCLWIMSPKSGIGVDDTEMVGVPSANSVRGQVATGVSFDSLTFLFPSRLDCEALSNLSDYEGTID